LPSSLIQSGRSSADSQAPELFWAAEENLEAACSPCNYGGGAHIAAANRRSAGERIAELEQRNAELERAVQWVEGRLEELGLALAAARNGPTAEAVPNGRRPAIF
jgi:hypothetical protein